jgi:uncharacterized damage-inducible protein DinB
MPTIDDQGRPEPAPDGDEVATLLGFLEFQRATFEWKCRDLDADDLRLRVAASEMSLGGLLKHLAWVEDYWCSRRLVGNPPAAPWAEVDWESDRDWEWHSAAGDEPDTLHALWRASVDRSRALVAEAIATGGLGTAIAVPWPDGTAPNLRWVLVHLIEEYARHNGHADLLREAADGATGE